MAKRTGVSSEKFAVVMIVVVVSMLGTTTTIVSSFMIQQPKLSSYRTAATTSTALETSNSFAFRSTIASIMTWNSRNVTATIADGFIGYCNDVQQRKQPYLLGRRKDRTFAWGTGSLATYETKLKRTVSPASQLQEQHMMFRETSSRSRSAAVLQEKQLEYTIYCDLDGVLVDFEHGVRKVFPDIECSHDEEFPIQQLKSRNVLWDRIQSSNSFFEHLPWATGGKQLWNILHSHTKRTNRQLHILTGVPTYETSRIEKFRWCQRELNLPSLDHIDMAGPFRSHMPGLYHANAKWYGKKDTTTRDVMQPPNSYDVDTAAAWQNTYDKIVGRCDQPATNVITCWSERKHHESKPGAVLIDDRIDLKHAWEQKGGIFIHHQTGNIMNTIEQLMFHGIIQEEDWIDHLQHPKRGDVVDDELNLNNIPKQQPRRDDSLYIW